MAKFYSNTLPAPGDTALSLLEKLVQRLGGTLIHGETLETLLAKILALLPVESGSPGTKVFSSLTRQPGDTAVTLLEKTTQKLGGSLRWGENTRTLLAKLIPLLREYPCVSVLKQYPTTLPNSWDSELVLLEKIVQRLGGSLRHGENVGTLLAKLLVLIGNVDYLIPGSQLVADFVSRAGISDAGQITALLNLVNGAMAHGWWDKCDLIYPFVGANATAHAQNLKSSNFTITWNGSVTHDADGVLSDGTSGYGTCGYIIGTSGSSSLNSVHGGAYRRTFGSAGTLAVFGSATSGVGTFWMLTGALSNSQIRAQANDTTNSFVNDSSLGFSAIARLDASAKHVYTGGADTQIAAASTGVPPFPILILGYSNNGEPSVGFSNASISAITVGAGVSFAEYQLMASDWQTFQTALGRQV